MRYRMLSQTGDYTFGSGQQNFYINSPSAVAQAVETYLKLWLGEWYLNVNDGTPYLEGVIGVHSQQTADTTMQATINQVQGVSGLSNYSSTIDPVTRQYSSISATLYTIYGETELNISYQEDF